MAHRSTMSPTRNRYSTSTDFRNSSSWSARHPFEPRCTSDTKAALILSDCRTAPETMWTSPGWNRWWESARKGFQLGEPGTYRTCLKLLLKLLRQCRKAITRATHGLYVIGTSQRLERQAHAADVHVHGPLLDAHAGGPQAFQQLHAREH